MTFLKRDGAVGVFAWEIYSSDFGLELPASRMSQCQVISNVAGQQPWGVTEQFSVSSPENFKNILVVRYNKVP